MEIAGFILTCVLTFIVAAGIAMLAERTLIHDRKSFQDTHYIAYTAMFACIATVLMLLEIPLFFIPSFYKIDLSEVPVLICTFYLGPVSGVICELLKVILKLLFKGTTTAFVGDYANFVVGCTFILPSSIIYHIRPSRGGAIRGLIAGTLTMTVFGSLFNALYLLPKYSELFGWPLEQIISAGTAVNAGITDLKSFVLLAVAPFNLIKGAVDSVLTMLLYKRISPILHKGDSQKKEESK